MSKKLLVKLFVTVFITIAAIFCPPTSRAQIISTIAGTTDSSYLHTFSGDGGPATNAMLSRPSCILVDARTGAIFISDNGNNRIRKITETGIITTVAGSDSAGFGGDGGMATDAKLAFPQSLVQDSAGNLYIADEYNQRVRMVNTSGIISTFAGNGTAGDTGNGGPATAAQLNYPYGLAIDATGNIYISEQLGGRIRKVTRAGIISTFAGSDSSGYGGDGGPATLAQLNEPYGLAIDTAGSLLIVDEGNFKIRKVTRDGIITTVAGSTIFGATFSGDGGPATAANLYVPTGVAVDADNNIYIADMNNQRIRKIDGAGIITTIAGNGFQSFLGDGWCATIAQLNNPQGVAVDRSGNVLIADSYNNRIRKVNSCPALAVDSVSGAHSFCAHSSIILTDATPGGSWTSSDSTVAIVSPSGVVSGLSWGYVTITYSKANSCGLSGSVATIYMMDVYDAGIITGVDSICPGIATLLTDPYPLGVWSTSDSSIASIASSGLLTPLAPGPVTVRYITTNTCGSDTATYPVSVRSGGLCEAGVAEVTTAAIPAITLSPNPNNGECIISVVTPTNEPSTLIVQDLMGRKIKEYPITTNNPVSFQLHLPAGTYFISAITKWGRLAAKMVVQ